jgi:CubicO group peptidase (beta-lactamase class C family)
MKNPLLIACCLILPINILFAQHRFDGDKLYTVDSLLTSYYKPDKPGIALAIIEKGETIYTRHVGLANIEHGVSITDSTAFHIASVSKQFTAYMAVSLAKEGKLSLEDDVREHLQELKQLPYSITLRQLANHTHGLPNLFELARLRGIGIEDHMTHREVVQMLLHIKQVNFKPGEKYEYNNTGYVLLAEVIARVCKEPFQDILRSRIFSPLGMRNSIAVDNSSNIVKNKAYSYRLYNGKYENHPFHIMANGSSGISTTINDMRQWAINFYDPSAEVRAVLQEMLKPTLLNSRDTIQYGLGLEFKNYKGFDVIFHGGGDAGYRSYMLHVPKYKFSVVILGNNNDFTPLLLAYELVDLFLKEYQQQPVAPEKIQYTTQELKPFVGTYEMFPGIYYNILADNDTLFFQTYGANDRAPLPVICDGDFLFPYIPTSKFSFYENGFDFHIADFKYACKKVNLNPPKLGKADLVKFAGHYRNNELNTEYELIIENDNLVAVHSFNNSIILYPLDKASFHSNESFFGKLDFINNRRGKIIGFQLSGQNLNCINFIKIR